MTTTTIPSKNVPTVDQTIKKEPVGTSRTAKEPNLEKEILKNQQKRDETSKNHLHYAFVCFIWVGFSLLALVFMIRVIHFILPSPFQWLDATQIQGIDKLIFSGAIGGFVGRYFKRFY